MSLFVVGSCSRITRNIVLQLARNNQYKQITIGDLLPTYNFHNRFYHLQRDLDDAKVQTQVSLDKLLQPSQLYRYINNSDDVLFVTHDYYEHVTSKTKLMQMVAEYGKNKTHLFFATPIEYDHHGYQNPEQNYHNTQSDVRHIAPNSTIIRSDIQDKTEFFAYYNHSKNIWEDQLLKMSAKKGFAPHVVSAQKYAQVVAEQMASRNQGKYVCVKGEQEVRPEDVQVNREVESDEWNHAKGNIRNIANKYTGVFGADAETLKFAL